MRELSAMELSTGHTWVAYTIAWYTVAMSYLVPRYHRRLARYLGLDVRWPRWRRRKEHGGS
jgi:hypothetical protein